MHSRAIHLIGICVRHNSHQDVIIYIVMQSCISQKKLKLQYDWKLEMQSSNYHSHRLTLINGLISNPPYELHNNLKRSSIIPNHSHRKFYEFVRTSVSQVLKTYLPSIWIILLFISIQQSSKSKIRDLNVVWRFHQDVTGREVPVHQSPLLQVHHTLPKRRSECF